MTQPNSLYYEASGQFSVVSIAIASALGSVLAPLLGLIYGYVVLYNPFLYINILAMLAFGFLLGLVCVLGINIGKIRSGWVAAGVGVFVGSLGLYVSWIVWIHALFARVGEDIWVVDPFSLMEIIGAIAQEGVWSIFDATPTGLLLYALWGTEALIVVGISAFVAMMAGGKPFCEECNAWSDDVYTTSAHVMAENRGVLQETLETGNILALTQVPKSVLNEYFKLTLSECPECKALGFFTVEWATVDDEGKEHTEDYIANLIVRGDALEQARKLQDPEVWDSAEPAPPTSEPPSPY